ncbi:MAG: HopJ type III effector protein [Solimonas sp.]
MSVEALLERLRETPERIELSETIAAIESAYDCTPTAFRNGDVRNEAGQNAGSPASCWRSRSCRA